jgi:hypothetical protein
VGAAHYVQNAKRFRDGAIVQSAALPV